VRARFASRGTIKTRFLLGENLENTVWDDILEIASGTVFSGSPPTQHLPTSYNEPVTATSKRYTVEEYLELERQSDVRHEYVDGELLAMAGEKRLHHKIARNIARALDEATDARGCEVALEAIKLRTKGTKFRYPDVIVSCEPGNDPYFLENPCFIAEVLSESTANVDTNDKLEEYTRLPSLERYALVDQNLRRVILYRRTEPGWVLEILEDGSFDVPCLGASVSVDQVYAGVNFESAEANAVQND
jgi:Uma2 family endonuclease